MKLNIFRGFNYHLNVIDFFLLRKKLISISTVNVFKY